MTTYDAASRRAKLRGLSLKSLLVVEECEERIGRDPDDAGAHFSPGRQWDYIGDYGKALEHYDAATRLDPGAATVLRDRARPAFIVRDARAIPLGRPHQ